jgi:hypothetical protein
MGKLIVTPITNTNQTGPQSKIPMPLPDYTLKPNQTGPGPSNKGGAPMKRPPMPRGSGY